MLRVPQTWLSYLGSFSKDIQSFLGGLLALTSLFLRKLNHLPSQLHWFCNLCDGSNLTEQAKDDTAEDLTRIKMEDSENQGVEYRQRLVTDCLQLFAYNGEDVLPHQEHLKNQIDIQLGKCDICILQYYKAKHRAIQALRMSVCFYIIHHDVE